MDSKKHLLYLYLLLVVSLSGSIYFTLIQDASWSEEEERKYRIYLKYSLFTGLLSVTLIGLTMNRLRLIGFQ